MCAPARTSVASVVLLAMLAMACERKHEAVSESESTAVVGRPSVARVTAGEHGFAPSSLTLPKGEAGSTIPVTFMRTTDNTCATEVVFPELGLKKELPLNVPVILDLPSDIARTFTFQCGMAMYKGALLVK